MNIAVTAHDRRKELMVQFCIAYCGIIARHSLSATSTTGQLVAEATGLPVELYLPGVQGGVQQLGARIAYNELDLVLYFSDPDGDGPSTRSVMEISRLCDQYNIPFASNIATAEVLIHGLRRGDLDWRDIVNPKK
jgi:methylglyoxal synthase